MHSRINTAYEVMVLHTPSVEVHGHIYA